MKVKKILFILLFSYIATFANSNFVTIIELNSLSKIQGGFLLSNPSYGGVKKLKLDDLINERVKNINPYAYVNFELGAGEDNSPTVITYVGEKTITYGSIYAKGFGQKYNINNLAYFVKNSNKQDYGAALISLESFNKEDLIYIRSKKNVVTKNEFYGFENYLKKAFNEDEYKMYGEKLNYIYSIIDYTNNVYNLAINNMKYNIIQPSFFNLNKLSSTENVTYNNKNNSLDRQCPNGDVISTIKLSEPVYYPQLYTFMYNQCPPVFDDFISFRSFMKFLKKQNNQKAKTEKQMREFVIKKIKEERNGGWYLEEMRNIFSKLNSDHNIQSSLSNINKNGITNGKIMVINFGVTEKLNNNTIELGFSKKVTVGSAFRNKFRIQTNDSFIYNANSMPYDTQELDNTVSELTENDNIDNSKYNTFYYVINVKPSKKVPERNDFHLKTENIPDKHRTDIDVRNAIGGEIAWVTTPNGTVKPIATRKVIDSMEDIIVGNNEGVNDILGASTKDEFDKFNKHEIKYEDEEISARDGIIEMKNILTSLVDATTAGDSFYPINLVALKSQYFPSNPVHSNYFKYFGPTYNVFNLYIMKHEKEHYYWEIETRQDEYNCENVECPKAIQERWDAGERPVIHEYEVEVEKKDPNKSIFSKHCSLEIDNPNMEKYNYFILKERMVKFKEKRFGDIRSHANFVENDGLEIDIEENIKSDDYIPAKIQHLDIDFYKCADGSCYDPEYDLSDNALAEICLKSTDIRFISEAKLKKKLSDEPDPNDPNKGGYGISENAMIKSQKDYNNESLKLTKDFDGKEEDEEKLLAPLNKKIKEQSDLIGAIIEFLSLDMAIVRTENPNIIKKNTSSRSEYIPHIPEL